jgi:predicted signal transduction protein with EAL and GGDEF domain
MTGLPQLSTALEITGSMTGAAPSDGASSWHTDQLRALEKALSPALILRREAFLDALNTAIRESIATGRRAGAVLIDINDFAEVNARCGPSGGDIVLSMVGERIENLAGDVFCCGAGPAPIVGRLDADHFGIVIAEAPELELLKAGTARLVRLLAEPLTVAGEVVKLSARAAIVQIPVHARSVTTALGRGFRLLNTTARTRADGVAVSEADASLAAARIMLERDLAAALTTDQLFIALQPKVETTTGLVQGAEALVRWHHPEQGLLPPPVFIEAAEKSGLIFDLGLRILRDACRAGNSLSQNGRKLTVAVNVSPLQLAHPDFLSRFLEVIDREGVEPQMLEIEVTETAAMMGGQRVNESLQSLRRCGIGVAIDDFGTGFSNLASLAALPADTLKIDRSLVTGGDHGGRSGALLDIAVQLGRTFGMETIAEGVETTQQMRHVAELGCDLVQGYFTGRPVRAGDFAEYYLRD